MTRDQLSALSAFLVVAEERSFTKAARRLEVSASALSHALRRLEERIGVRLLARTTRSVTPTEAGEQLIAHLRPALSDIRGALESIGVSAICESGLSELPQLLVGVEFGNLVGEVLKREPWHTTAQRVDRCEA